MTVLLSIAALVVSALSCVSASSCAAPAFSGSVCESVVDIVAGAGGGAHPAAKVHPDCTSVVMNISVSGLSPFIVGLPRI